MQRQTARGYERAISSYLLTCRILSFVCPSLYTAVVYFVVYLTFCLHFVVRVSAAPDPKAPTSEARVSGFPAEGDRASTSQESQDETRSSRRPITATPRATSPVRSSFNARRHNGGAWWGHRGTHLTADVSSGATVSFENGATEHMREQSRPRIQYPISTAPMNVARYAYASCESRNVRGDDFIDTLVSSPLWFRDREYEALRS